MHYLGWELASINGTATRKPPKNIQAMPLAPIPDTILDLYPTLELSMDYVCVQVIHMMHSISSKYKFRTIEAARGRNKPNQKTMVDTTNTMLHIYKTRGLQVPQINAECISESMRPISMDIVTTGEHVGKIERSNMTIKGRTRCHVHQLDCRIIGLWLDV